MQDAVAENRRKYKRYRVDLISALIMNNGVRHTATARNMSAGGIFVECDKPIAKGEQLRLSMNLNRGGRMQRFEVDAEVTHGPSRVSMSLYGIGLAFEADADQEALLNWYLDGMPAL